MALSMLNRPLFFETFPRAASPFGAVVTFEIPMPCEEESKAVMKSTVDVVEKPDMYVFYADLPGMKKENVKVQLRDGRTLSISGERSRHEPKEDEKYHLVERSSGRFERLFKLPPNADTSRIGAKCVDGVLTVTVAKRPVEQQVKPTEISIA